MVRINGEGDTLLFLNGTYVQSDVRRWKLIALRSEVRKLGEVTPTNGDVSKLLI